MSNNPNSKTTHFGYKSVAVDEKASKVANVFHSVAKNYDLMNDLMSLGTHRLWKRFTINLARVRSGEQLLDLASGTGDLAMKFVKQVGSSGRVVASDINESMLEIAQSRFLDKGIVNNIEFKIADAEALPFEDSQFDCVTMAFGLRNVTRKEKALGEMHRVLKPGGRCLILEFSHPIAPGLKPLYDLYSFAILPKLGEVFASDRESYQYLAESIRMHPDQETLKNMMSEANFDACDFHNLSGGIVAVHRGYKS